MHTSWVLSQRTLEWTGYAEVKSGPETLVMSLKSPLTSSCADTAGTLELATYTTPSHQSVKRRVITDPIVRLMKQSVVQLRAFISIPGA